MVLVKGTALFSGLPDELFSTLLKAANVHHAKSGEVIFMQGDEATGYYIVLEGWIKLYRLNSSGNEAVVAVFTRGQSFAEAAVFSMKRYPVTAEAVATTRLLHVPRSVLLDSVRKDPEFAFAMLGSTAHHLQELIGQIEQLKTYTATQRVARFLASLCPVEEGACTIGLPYDKTLIAGRLGMKPESLSRAFARLRNLGVRVDHSAAAIACVERLRDYADEDRQQSKLL
jgi:CRP-like cAMP-binding protein